MTLKNLENLVKTKLLKSEPKNLSEIDGLLHSGNARLTDATNPHLSNESRFDLAYNAAHSLALAALRWHGYRPSNRYVVFQTIPHTIGLGPEVWRVLAKCHDQRNIAEYEGFLEIDGKLLDGLISASQTLLDHVHSLVQNG